MVLIEHGYATTEYESRIIAAAGGEFIDADRLPLSESLKLCETADGVMCRRINVTREMLGRWRRCKIVMRYGVGTDNVDVEAATEAGIIAGHVPVYCVDEVSTHAISLLLACARNLAGTHQRMADGEWETLRSTPLWRMKGRTLGIVGLGKIGQAVAEKMRPWGLQILATDPYVDPATARAAGAKLVSLDQLCREADYLTLHCPLLPETRHLIGAPQMRLMKQGAIIVNTARGPVLDTSALVAALDAGQVARAGLDVFESEPLPADSPLRKHPHLVLTDHVSWYSEESQVELQTKAAEDVARVCTGGLPVSLANPEVLQRLGRCEEWTPPEQMQWQLKRLEAMQKAK